MNLSELGPSAAVVVVVIYFLQYMAAESKKRDDSHDKLVKSIDKNTKVTEETYTYLKHRNGSFEKLIKDAPALHDLLKRVDKAK